MMCKMQPKLLGRPEWTHPKEERKLPAVEADPKELRLQALLLHNVVVVAGFHFL